MTEVTGTLLFRCFNVRTVDENDLPAPDEYRDGLKQFEVQQFCCEIMKKFNEDNDSKISMTTQPYPDLLNSRGEPTLILDIEYDGYESSYEEEIPIECCPWCQTKPTIKVIRQKHIKRCIEEIIPEQKKQTCSIKIVTDDKEEKVIAFDRY